MPTVDYPIRVRWATNTREQLRRRVIEPAIEQDRAWAKRAAQTLDRTQDTVVIEDRNELSNIVTAINRVQNNPGAHAEWLSANSLSSITNFYQKLSEKVPERWLQESDPAHSMTTTADTVDP